LTGAQPDPAGQARATTEDPTIMKLVKYVNAGLVIGALLVALSACQKPEGPAEHAGKEIDQAVDKAGQEIEKAGDKLQDATKPDKK
jgi:hypothetical protein